MILIAVALSGCTGTDKNSSSSINSNSITTDVQTFNQSDTNLDAKIVEVKFDRNDVIAGEKVITELSIANMGSEKITNETIELKAKVLELDDSVANLYLKTLSEEKKVRDIPAIAFDTEIDPGTVRSISAVFNTQREMEGRSLAGRYEISVTLSVNGQKMETQVMQISLKPGVPREFIPTPSPTPAPSPAPVIEPEPTPSLTEPSSSAAAEPENIEQSPTPTPTSTPVVVAKPTGKIRYTRVRSDKFMENLIQINAGDTVLWDNYDVLTSLTYNISELDGKLPNITLPEAKKANYTFTVAGDYKFGLFYKDMRGIEPSNQIIIVKMNESSQ